MPHKPFPQDPIYRILQATEHVQNHVTVDLMLNPITYGILRFCQLHVWGAFGPRPRKQGYGYRINLKFATNNGMDDTSKHVKFKVIGCSTFRDMT